MMKSKKFYKCAILLPKNNYLTKFVRNLGELVKNVEELKYCYAIELDPFIRFTGVPKEITDNLPLEAQNFELLSFNDKLGVYCCNRYENGNLVLSVAENNLYMDVIFTDCVKSFHSKLWNKFKNPTICSKCGGTLKLTQWYSGDGLAVEEEEIVCLSCNYLQYYWTYGNDETKYYRKIYKNQKNIVLKDGKYIFPF